MALKNYAEIDESDYYGQGFEKAGFVSLWAGLSDQSTRVDGIDVLQDLCGVGYYNIDNQESNCHEFQIVFLSELLEELSYSKSFRDEAVDVAADKGARMARWVVAQFDFAYDPKRVKREIAEDPIFLGVFPYTRNDD